MNKEYIFTMSFDDGEYQKIWKCVISEDKCVTYAEDELCETFDLTTTVRAPHVIQLDTVAKVFDENLPLQVENGMPFIKIDGVWEASDTTEEDRLQAKIRAYKKESYFYAFVGLALIVFYVIDKMFIGLTVEIPIALVMGIFCISSGGMTMLRLRNELGEMGRKLDWMLHRSDFKKQD